MTPSQQAHYEQCLAEGCSPALAEMFALGVPPGANTDREFLAGHCNGSQFEKDPDTGDRLAADLVAAGGDPKGKVYLGGLAAYPGDPRAWVADRGDVKKLCEERNYTCTGSVAHRGDNSRGEPQTLPEGT